MIYSIISRYILSNVKYKNINKYKPKKSILFIFFIFIMIFSLYNVNYIIYNRARIKNNNIIMLEDGYSEWKKPDYTVFGIKTMGMFGCLPMILENYGYNVELIQSQTIPIKIVDANILVIINLNYTLDDVQNKIIWNFVKNGGSLFILGDHTDIQGIMNHTNSLLKPINIKFCFDSAFYLKEHWINCLNLLTHPITRNIHNVNDIKWGIGASLKISYPAVPIIIGRYSFSDTGNYDNEQEAYLGNYKYDKGEQLGDLVLAAEVVYGKGKVLVFGDTSSLQNPCLPYNYKFIYDVFNYLSYKGSNSTYLYYNFFISLMIFLIIFIQRNYTFFIIFLIVIVFLLYIIPTNIIRQLYYPLFSYNNKIAYIDNTHCNAYNLEGYTDNSVDGLIYNIYRNDYIPRFLNSFTYDDIKKSSILIIIGPTKPFSNYELNVINKFIVKGGTVIISIGWYEKTLTLCNEFNFTIDPVPLGPYPYVDIEYNVSSYEIRFIDSWSLKCDKTYYVYYSTKLDNEVFNLIIIKKIGFGTLVVISDSRFLLNNNLENNKNWWMGNIFFLKKILHSNVVM